jgi:hypothetical protein
MQTVNTVHAFVDLPLKFEVLTRNNEKIIRGFPACDLVQKPKQTLMLVCFNSLIMEHKSPKCEYQTPKLDVTLNHFYQARIIMAYFLLAQINYPLVSSLVCGPGSVVSIATGYGLDGLEIESRWRRDFPHLSRWALVPTQPPVEWVLGLSWE